MKGLYLDCPAGAAGDMILAALLDCGLSLEIFQQQLELLPLDGYTLQVERVKKHGLRALAVKFEAKEKQPLRDLAEIGRLIGSAGLSAGVKKASLAAFQKLAEAEAAVHGVPVEKVHFHEIGALDSILDIAGCMIALEMLGVLEEGEIRSSPLPLGRGWTTCSHGKIPLPAPATVELLKKHRIPCYGLNQEGETVTPTGAALLATICSGYSSFPLMRMETTGCGAGSKDFPFPNLLRVFAGELGEKGACSTAHPGGDGEDLLVEPATILEANIDDLNPEIYEHVMESLFAAGALDVFLTPVQMKKNRPGVKITVLTNPQQAHLAGLVLLRETTTLGFRRSEVLKTMLPREEGRVETPWGPVRVKKAGSPPEYCNMAPEYEDCLRISREHNIPLKKVYQEVWKNL